ncbi:hypothetical protein GCM10010218_18730 [Streptomyces mashuensis]|uniref:histidine kinase n=1 Tax=Streptomyces mashuensis TaxID=33904 RepID=A0A919B2B4_9ACTN|nr:hypothetical protein GCM10010218_18730 [Streptomyces mashuensis]
MALLLVPLVSLTALWVFATVLTGTEAARLLSVSDVMSKVGYPAGDMVRTLQKERRQALIHLADPRRADTLAELRADQRATDKAVAAFRAGIDNDVRADMSDAAAARFRAFEKALGGIEALRRRTEDNDLTRYAAYQGYNGLIEPYYAFLATLGALQDADMDRQGRAIVGLARAREAVAREDALFASALAAGTIARRDLRTVADRVAERETLYATHLADLPAEDRKAYQDYWEGPNARALRAAEDAAVLAGSPGAVHAVDPARWDQVAGPVLDDLGRMSTEAVERFGDRVRPVALGVLTKAAVAGVLGLVALVASLVVSFRIGRGLVRDLRTLRKEAHEISGVRLPGVMRRLAAGETVDVDTEVPRRTHGPDELGQVAQALNTLQRAAVEAAVKQADLRRGVSDVFVNLARRSQVLLHRQLTLLDAMERRTEDTGELADLFRLDHLTTRMRRHAEGLVILSGSVPARQWRRPVPLMDVVRAAVAEVEAYERIDVRRLPRLALVGPAVADVTHLLAELLENATVFSPPHSTVQVTGENGSNGFTLEIHDRGLGMTSETLQEANLKLTGTPEFELSDTDRLGLFVVSRLARRQDVRVSLQPSAYGGTTAVVLIPSALLTEAPPRAGERGGDEDTGSRPAGVPVVRPRKPVHPPEQHHKADDAPAVDRAAPAPGSGDDPTPTGGLPRRVRQASLVPQLKEAPRPRPEPTTAPPTADEAAEREAETARARMRALQRGWRRGREQENAPDPAGLPGPPGSDGRDGTTAPGTTTEGDGR